MSLPSFINSYLINNLEKFSAKPLPLNLIICYGNCRKTFHVQCINVNYSAIKAFNKNKGFYYFCDKCDPFADNNIIRDLLSNTTMIQSLLKRLKQLIDKVDIISNSSFLQRKQTRSVTSNASKRKSNELDVSLPHPSRNFRKALSRMLFYAFVPKYDIAQKTITSPSRL